MVGDGPLAVNSTTSAMYYFDMHYHWIRWRDNQYGQLQSELYQPASYTTASGTSVIGGDSYAFDDSDVLYTLAHGTGGEYLVAHAENTGTPIITPLNVPSYQVFDMESLPDGSIAIATADPASDQLIVVGDPLDAGSSVDHATLPSGCAYRITAGTAHDIYVSACASFNQIFHYSSTLQLIASATVPNAKHINALAPDETTGGVWFSDDRANLYGSMGPSGVVKTYPAPVGIAGRITGVATASDGTILATLYDGSTQGGGPFDTLVQILENGTNCCAYVAPDYIGPRVTPQYFRGSNGLASCAPQVYWLSANGNVVRITL
ncbi:MAG: hypothetical protein ACXWNZ_11035 [Vulcanimicrobiaceae bacterium]